jgi:hypothetical protein
MTNLLSRSINPQTRAACPSITKQGTIPCRRIVIAPANVVSFIGREPSEQPDQTVTTNSTRHAQGETVFLRKGKANIHTGGPLNSLQW